MKYNICYVFDKVFINHGMIALYSLICNNPEREMDIYVLQLDMTVEDVKKVERLGDEKHRIIVIDAHSYVEQIKDINCGNWSIMAIVRLLMEVALPESIEKILYIDADTVVAGNVDTIFNTDIEDYLGAAVLDKYISVREKKKIGINEKSPYFNSGVIYVNLKKWREYKIGKKCIDYLLHNSELNTMPDQNALNIFLENNYQILPLSCNVDGYTTLLPYESGKHIFKEDITKYYSISDYEDARKNPIIVHYIGWYLDKPWVEGNLQPLSYLYDEVSKSAGIGYKKIARKPYTGYLVGNIKNRARKGIEKAINNNRLEDVVKEYMKAEYQLQFGSRIKRIIKKIKRIIKK